MPTSLDLATYAPGTFEVMDRAHLHMLSPDDLVFITTKLGTQYRVRLNTMVGTDRHDKVHILVAMLPQEVEHRQHAQSIVTVGESWELNDSHTATDEIQSISRVRPAA
jgi:hypothetical protein